MSTRVSVLDTTQMQRVGSQIGSNPAGIFQDQQGQRYYVKELESVAHARNEWLAAQLYQLAGAPTLTYVPTRNPLQIATRWVELEKRYVAHLDQPEREQAQHWLGVHAWTANWDAVGLTGDNQGVFQGRVLTLDLGGALAFRAQGDPKGRAFGRQVEELERLRASGHNAQAYALFGDMSESQLEAAIRVVTALSDSQIAETVLGNAGSEALVDKMLARKQDMARRL